MPSLIMFDLDGTLVDTAAEIAAAINAALASFGRPAVDQAAVRGWVGRGARELARRRHRGGDEQGDPLGVEHCLTRFRAAPGRALFAGESEIDVATAHNAGVALCRSLAEAVQRLAA